MQQELTKHKTQQCFFLYLCHSTQKLNNTDSL